jgi:hypothetical protein
MGSYRQSLDNAMAHDIMSLFAKDAISCKGEYTRMDISFRPPGSPQRGAIVERMVGSFKQRLREDMGKIAIDISEFLTSNTDKQAAQIVEYMERRFIKIIDEYHHTRHSTLHQCPIDAGMKVSII